MLRVLAILLALCILPLARAQPASTVQLEEMTWTELRDRIAAGTTTVLVPIGGTEQNGPHMVLGKHNVRARVLAAEIARRLGNAVVAPVLSYVPEGSVRPPAGHMRFTGTISIPEATFEAVLDATARSLRQHGFRDVVFLGDHGGYQRSQVRIAERLNHEWRSDPRCRVHALPEYYAATQAAYRDALRQRGFAERELGRHAGLADTALALAVDAALVRKDLLAAAAQRGAADGVEGDPARATVELGQLGVRAIVEASVAAIKAAVATRRR